MREINRHQVDPNNHQNYDGRRSKIGIVQRHLKSYPSLNAKRLFP